MKVSKVQQTAQELLPHLTSMKLFPKSACGIAWLRFAAYLRKLGLDWLTLQAWYRCTSRARALTHGNAAQPFLSFCASSIGSSEQSQELHLRWPAKWHCGKATADSLSSCPFCIAVQAWHWGVQVLYGAFTSFTSMKDCWRGRPTKREKRHWESAGVGSSCQFIRHSEQQCVVVPAELLHDLLGKTWQVSHVLRAAAYVATEKEQGAA